MSALHISSERTKTPEQTFSDLLRASLLERDDSVQAALETGLTGGVKDASQDRRGAVERNSLDAEVSCRHSHLPGSPAQRQTEAHLSLAPTRARAHTHAISSGSTIPSSSAHSVELRLYLIEDLRDAFHQLPFWSFFYCF